MQYIGETITKKTVSQTRNTTPEPEVEDDWLTGLKKTGKTAMYQAARGVAGMGQAIEEYTPADLARTPFETVAIPLKAMEWAYEAIHGKKPVGTQASEIVSGIGKRATSWLDDNPATSNPFYKTERLFNENGPLITEQAAKALGEAAKQETPVTKKGSLKYHVMGGLQSIPLALTAAGASMLTKKPSTGLNIFFGTQGGQTYAEKREAGIDPAKAGAAGLISGAAEKYTEMLPFQALMKEGTSLLTRAAKSTALDVPGELIATTLQNGLVDKATTNPDFSWGDYWDALKDTAIQTMITGPVQSAAMHPAVRYMENRQVKAIEGELKNKDDSKRSDQDIYSMYDAVDTIRKGRGGNNERLTGIQDQLAGWLNERGVDLESTRLSRSLASGEARRRTSKDVQAYVNEGKHTAISDDDLMEVLQGTRELFKKRPRDRGLSTALDALYNEAATRTARMTPQGPEQGPDAGFDLYDEEEQAVPEQTTVEQPVTTAPEQTPVATVVQPTATLPTDEAVRTRAAANALNVEDILSMRESIPAATPDDRNKAVLEAIASKLNAPRAVYPYEQEATAGLARAMAQGRDNVSLDELNDYFEAQNAPIPERKEQPYGQEGQKAETLLNETGKVDEAPAPPPIMTQKSASVVPIEQGKTYTATKGGRVFPALNAESAAKWQKLGWTVTEEGNLVTDQSPPSVSMVSDQVEAVQPDFAEMVKEAARWKGAAQKADGLYDSNDKRSRLSHSNMTTKGDLDAYLIKKYGIDESGARDVSNELTRKNIPADRTANVEDFRGEPWADNVLKITEQKKEEAPAHDVEQKRPIPQVAQITKYKSGVRFDVAGTKKRGDLYLIPGFEEIPVIAVAPEGSIKKHNKSGWRAFTEKGQLIYSFPYQKYSKITALDAVQVASDIFHGKGKEKVLEALNQPTTTHEQKKEEAPAPEQKKPAEKEILPGTRDIAQRIVNGEEAFISAVQEQFGKTKEEAERVLARFRKDKLVKVDPVTGQFTLKHGATWEQEVIDRAAQPEVEKPAPAIGDTVTWSYRDKKYTGIVEGTVGKNGKLKVRDALTGKIRTPNPARAEGFEILRGVFTMSKPEPKANKGVENIIGRIIQLGGINAKSEYSTKLLKQDPDMKRVLRTTGMTPDDMASMLRDEGYVGFESGDGLIELLKEGKGRETYNPARYDEKFEETIREAEDEWIEEQLATLEAEGIDGERIAESRGDILAGFESKIAEEGLSETDEQAALEELDSFFDAVVKEEEKPAEEKPAAPTITDQVNEHKKQNQTLELPGTSYEENFSLTAPEGQVGYKLNLHPDKVKNGDLFSENKSSYSVAESSRSAIIAEKSQGGKDEERNVSATGRAVGDRENERGGIVTHGSRLGKELQKRGFIDLRGQEVETFRDLAELAQIFRDQRVETLRIFYVKDGIIVGHEGLSSRMPGFSNFYGKEGLARRVYDIQRRIQRLNADSVYLLHNHPSGRPNASGSDIRVTEFFKKSIPELQGHVIIDHTQYGVIDFDETANDSPLANPPRIKDLAEKTDEASPAVPHPLLGANIAGFTDVANIAHSLKKGKGYATLIYRLASGKVGAIQDVPVGILKSKDAINFLRGRAREFGAMEILLHVDDISTVGGLENIDRLITSSALLDATFYEQNNVLSSARLKGIVPDKNLSFGKAFEKYYPHRVSEDSALYARRASTLALGLPVAKIQGVVDTAKGFLKNAPAIHVLQSTQEIPVEVLQHMEEHGILDEDGNSDVQGFSWNGEVYLVAENLDSGKETLFVLMHELTHDGLGSLLNRNTPNVGLRSIRFQYKSLMDAIWEAHEKEVRAIAGSTHTHLDISTTSGKRQAAEEWLCNQAYEAQPRWYDRLVSLFHDVIRAMGFKVKLSDAEVRTVLQDAFGAMGRKEGQPAYMRKTPDMDTSNTDNRPKSRAFERLMEGFAREIGESREVLMKGAGYEKMSMKEQNATSRNLVYSDYERAKRMLYGTEEMPEGLRHGNLAEWVAIHAAELGDLETLESLREAHSLLLTQFGQEIAAAYVEDSPLNSIAAIESVLKRKAELKGETMTAKERAEIDNRLAEYARLITEKNERIDALETEVERRGSKEYFDSWAKENGLEKARPETKEEAKREKPPRVKKEIKRVFTSEERHQANRQALREMGFQIHANIDPFKVTRILVEEALYYLEGGVRSLPEFSEKMSEYGEEVKPFISDAWDEARKKFSKDNLDKFSEKLKKASKEGKHPSSVGRTAEKIAKWFISEGTNDRETLVTQVHNVLRESFPEITRDETMDAISGYGKYKPPTQDEVLQTLHDISRQLQEVANEPLRQLANPKKTKEEIALQALSTRLKSEAEKYRKLLASMDFQKAEKRRSLIDSPELKTERAERDKLKQAYNALAEAAGKVTPEQVQTITILSRNMMDAREKVNKDGDSPEFGAAKVAFDRYVAELKGENSPIGKMIKDRIAQAKAEFKDNPAKGIWNAVRDTGAFIGENSISVVASLDNSFLGRQGINTLFTHPSVWWPAAVKSFSDMAKVMGGQNVRDALLAEIYSKKNYLNGTYKTAGLITDHEEQFPSSLPGRIPGFGRMFRASEVAFEGSALRMRTGIYDLLEKQAKDNGVDVADKKYITSMGKLVSSLTARAQFKRGTPTIARIMLWAPKMLVANLNVLSMHGLTAGLEHSAAKKEAAINLVKIIGSTALILAFASAFGADVEDDPLSTDFGKIKTGDTRFDVTGGKASIIILAFRMIQGKTKSANTGITTEFGTGYNQKNRFDALIDFLVGKTPPPTRLVIDWLKGTNFKGEKTTFASSAYKAFTPIALQNIISLKDNASADRVAGAILDALGISSNSYAPSEKKWDSESSEKMRQFRKTVGQEQFEAVNKEYNDLVNKRIKAAKSNELWNSYSDEEKTEALKRIRRFAEKDVFRREGFRERQKKRQNMTPAEAWLYE